MDPWSLYWQSKNLESCIAAESENDRQQIAQFWADIASGVDHSAQVLDLGCGNGVVAAHLLQASPDLSISAVDQADIAPESLSESIPELAKVAFYPRTSVTKLPFPDQSFDLLVSQFGVEYAELEAASAEAVRVLRPEGMLVFLVHHQLSDIVQPAMRHLQEVSALLAPAGVIDKALDFCNDKIDLESLEQQGREYLNGSVHRTSQISGQIFDGINQLIELVNSGSAEHRHRATQLVSTMQTRLQADQARLQQMASAALDQSDLAAWAKRYRSLGMDMHLFVAMTITGEAGKALIGWQLRGQKKPGGQKEQTG